MTLECVFDVIVRFSFFLRGGRIITPKIKSLLLKASYSMFHVLAKNSSLAPVCADGALIHNER